MRDLANRIDKEVKEKKVRWDIVEKDYALGHVLFGIAKQPELAKSLVFKGGTALKKCYFGDYRFSEDLDFSTIHAPKKQLLEDALNDSLQITKRYLSDIGLTLFEFQLERKIERNPHPYEQEAFDIKVKFPAHSRSLCRIKVEVTHDEPVILAPVHKPIIHGYDEPINLTIACYPIEEIIAEKLRALLQTNEKLTQGKMRARPRDYYDLWCLLKKYGDTIDKSRLKEVLQKKCAHRLVSYQTIDDFFTDLLVEQTSKAWEKSLKLQIFNLPLCEDVLKETKLLIYKIL
jgi:uncharacterized protein